MTGFQSKRMMSEVRWLGPYAPSDRFMDDVTLKDYVKLRNQNVKYREALELIAEGDGFYGAMAYEYKQIAKTALGGNHDG